MTMYTGILKKYSVSKIVIIKELGGCNVPNDNFFLVPKIFRCAGGGGYGMRLVIVQC